MSTPEDPKDNIRESGVVEIPALKDREALADSSRAKIEEISEFGNKLRTHIMSIKDHRTWIDNAKQVPVGFVDQKGKDIKDELEKELQALGDLVAASSPEDFPTELSSKLKEASELIDPSFVEGANEAVAEVAKVLSEMKSKIADIQNNPDYLLGFSEGGAFKKDLVQSLEMMERTLPVNNEAHLINRSSLIERVRNRMTKIGKQQEAGSDGSEIEFRARLEAHQELRSEVIEMANAGALPQETAEKMKTLISAHLSNLYSGISSQRIGLFNPEFEAGNTDADTFLISLEALNKSLIALHDMQESECVIPSFNFETKSVQ